MCYNITLVDDLIVEQRERFNVSGMLSFPPTLNVTIDPAMAVVFIEDNDIGMEASNLLETLYS